MFLLSKANASVIIVLLDHLLYHAQQGGQLYKKTIFAQKGSLLFLFWEYFLASFNWGGFL